MKKKMNNKGFTLVELIVVLVILAILAAILVPALLGYIDRAKEQQIVLNAKSALTASQAELSSMYGKGEKTWETANDTRIKNTADLPSTAEEFTIVTGAALDGKTHAAYTIIGFEYKENGKTLIFDGKSWDKDNTKPTGTDHKIALK